MGKNDRRKRGAPQAPLPPRIVYRLTGKEAGRVQGMQEILLAAQGAFNSLHAGYQSLLQGIASREGLKLEELAFDQNLLAFVKPPAEQKPQ